jgi:hypothetical protein
MCHLVVDVDRTLARAAWAGSDLRHCGRCGRLSRTDATGGAGYLVVIVQAGTWPCALQIGACNCATSLSLAS